MLEIIGWYKRVGERIAHAVYRGPWWPNDIYENSITACDILIGYELPEKEGWQRVDNVRKRFNKCPYCNKKLKRYKK